MSGLFRPNPGPLFFDGHTYDPPKDEARLGGQLARVAKAMRDGRWHTLEELVRQCGGTTASVSARLRDLRKARFGTHTVDRQRVAGNPGLFRYRMTQ
jgi:hypothetical protein